MKNNETFEMIVDELYSHYEAENSLQNVRYIHPMFYNGTFSENNSYQPPKPEEYRWNTAFQVLYNYISKNLSRKNK